MHTPSQYIEIINKAIDGLDYPSWLPGLYEPIRYTMSSGGKRLRPTLLLASSEAFGGNLHDAIWPAVGIEIFHNFTLVHDDVMDNAEMRRGRETVYKKWGVNTAILSGDAMVTMAYQSMSGCPAEYLPEVISRFSMMTMNVYEGQQMDAEFETMSHVSFGEYVKMIIGKTSALIAYPCAIGALLAGAAPADVEAMFNFGLNLGIAFQIMDDYLDVYGNPKTFGKEIGGDIMNDKKTWLYIMSQDHDADGAFKALLAAPLGRADKVARVTAHYDSLGLRDEGQKLIAHYTDDALLCLDSSAMPDQAKEWFRAYAERLVRRRS